MGYICKLSCECGYEKELKLGTGRNIPDAAYINENFSKEKLKRFQAALHSNVLEELFYIEHTMAYCKHCNKIKEGKLLHYQINQIEKTVHDVCDTCGHELTLIREDPKCPSCGKILEEETEGLWD